MKLGKLFAALLAAASSAACNEQPSAPEPEPASVAAPTPSVAAPLVIVSGQDITFIDGQAHLTMPDGWKIRPNAAPLTEMEAERYDGDLDRWARCHLNVTAGLNFRGATQEEADTKLVELSSGIADDIAASGLPSEVSHFVVAGNTRVATVSFSSDGLDTILHQLAVVDRVLAYLVYIDCDAAAPATEHDRTDFRSLLESFRFEPR